MSVGSPEQFSKLTNPADVNQTWQARKLAMQSLRTCRVHKAYQGSWASFSLMRAALSAALSPALSAFEAALGLLPLPVASVG